MFKKNAYFKKGFGLILALLLMLTSFSGMVLAESGESVSVDENVKVSGPWTSELYPEGTGYDDTKQFSEYLVDLGELININKVAIDHDSMKIMSFSLLISTDGEEYTPITDVYAGGVEKYSGEQIYRFKETQARYVKYRAVLLGNYETQAKLQSIAVSNTETAEMSFVNLPDRVNPLDSSEIILSVKAMDSNGDSYMLTRQGVIYELEGDLPSGVRLDGNVISLDKSVAPGTITIKASDASGAVTITKDITIDPQVAIRNFALYSNEDCTIPISALNANTNVYAKVEALSSEGVADKGIYLLLTAYEKVSNRDHILKVSSVYSDIAVSTEYKSVTVALTLPEEMPENSYIKAYVFSEDLSRYLAPPIYYSPNGTITGLSAQNIFVDKSDSFTIKASAPAGNITWESSNSRVAEVDENGTVIGKSEGNAVITAKLDGNVLASSTVKVKPSIYVFLMIGQSNVTGVNVPEGEGVTSLPISEGVMLLNKSGEFEPAKHRYSRHSGIVCSLPFRDATDKESELAGINMGYSFAEDFVKENPDTQIGLVVNSQAGCSITIYERHSTDPLANGFVNTLERTAQAISGRGELKAILWHQGESNLGEEDYTYRLRNVIYDFRKELGDLELPFIAGGINEDKTEEEGKSKCVEHNDRVNEQEQNIANFGYVSSREPFYITSRITEGDPEAIETGDYDNVHFSVRGQIEFGHRYYNKYLELVRKGKSNL